MRGDNRANLVVEANRRVHGEKTRSLETENQLNDIGPCMGATVGPFGPPLLLEGEDGVGYDELLARICAAVKPVNVIEEMFVADVVFLQWEIVRLRRLKLSLLKTSGHEALEDFLVRKLDCDLYAEAFTKDLAENLQKYIEEDEARELAKQCAWSEPGADEKVHQSSHRPRRTGHARNHEDGKGVYGKTSRTFARAARTESNQAGQHGSRLLRPDPSRHHGKGLTAKIEEIEQIDRLITIAEGRRTASLREIDRHRAVLGEAVRRNLQEVEDAEFEIVETMPREGKSAA
jgi:hypothetical protein